jgi:hypothetical protein
VAGTTLLGEYRAARAAIPSTFPGLLNDPPEVAGYRELDVLLSATALQRTGAQDQATRMLEAALEQSGQGLDAADRLVGRAMILAALDRTDESIAVFERAVAAGWRTPIDFDYFVRIEDYPFMAETARDPRFRKLMAGMEADLARMRETVLRQRGSAKRNA